MPNQDNLAKDLEYHIGQFIKKHDWTSLNECPAENKQLIYKFLIEASLKMKFWHRLASLYKFDKTSFNAVMALLENNTLKNMLAICIKHNFDENLLVFNFVNLGLLDYAHALIACAAIKSTSKHGALFTPIIVQDSEVKQFLAAIKDNLSIVLNRKITFLIIEESHWFTCEILFTEKNVRLFVIDSLGAPKVRSNYAFQDMRSFLSKNFPGKLFIQISALCTQNSAGTCQIFAFDYLRKLSRMPEIFAMLPFPSEEKETVALPLALLRTAQLSDLQQQIQQHPQYNPTELINKKGQTIDEAVNAHMTNEVVKGKERLTNRYLEHKHAMLFQKAITYLAETDPNQKEKDMKEFTVDAFAKQISKQSSSCPSMQ